MVSIQNPAVTVEDIWNYPQRNLTSQDTIVNQTIDRLLNNVLGDNFDQFSVGWYLTQGIAQKVINDSKNITTINHGYYSTIGDMEKNLGTYNTRVCRNNTLAGFSNVNRNDFIAWNEGGYIYLDRMTNPKDYNVYSILGTGGTARCILNVDPVAGLLLWNRQGAPTGLLTQTPKITSAIQAYTAKFPKEYTWYAPYWLFNYGAGTTTNSYEQPSYLCGFRYGEGFLDPSTTFTLSSLEGGEITYFACEFNIPIRNDVSVDIVQNGTSVKTYTIPAGQSFLSSVLDPISIKTSTTDTITVTLTTTNPDGIEYAQLINCILSEVINVPA